MSIDVWSNGHYVSISSCLRNIVKYSHLSIIWMPFVHVDCHDPNRASPPASSAASWKHCSGRNRQCRTDDSRHAATEHVSPIFYQTPQILSFVDSKGTIFILNNVSHSHQLTSASRPIMPTTTWHHSGLSMKGLSAVRRSKLYSYHCQQSVWMSAPTLLKGDTLFHGATELSPHGPPPAGQPTWFETTVPEGRSLNRKKIKSPFLQILIDCDCDCDWDLTKSRSDKD